MIQFKLHHPIPLILAILISFYICPNTAAAENQIPSQAELDRIADYLDNHTNVKQFGVPSIKGLKPYKSKYLDKTDKVDGAETRLDYFNVEGRLVAIWSYKSIPYSVAADRDFKNPVDLSLLDRIGNGTFVEISSKEVFYVPNWLIK